MKKGSGLARMLLGVAVLAMGLNAQAAEAADANNCSLKRLTSIDLIGGENGPAIIPVTLNGKRVGLALRPRQCRVCHRAR